LDDLRQAIIDQYTFLLSCVITNIPTACWHLFVVGDWVPRWPG